MSRDLTSSPVERQNILNNPYAVSEIEKAASISSIPFEGKRVVTREQVADFFEIDTRTITEYLAKHADELRRNGYEVVKGNRLKELKICLRTADGMESYLHTISRTSALGIFDFKAFLNLAMLLSESERAKLLRQAVLDIVIDTMRQKTGGATKYINHRDEEYLQSAFVGENYRKEFTDALKDYVDMGPFKYPVYTDKIYEAIFLEKAKEYRKILKLTASDKTRDTFYAEVLDLISAFEYGFSQQLKAEFERQARKLKALEVDELFRSFSNQHHWQPLINKARQRMASRDLAFRDALHERLSSYITPVDQSDFERFLGERSQELLDRIDEAKEVLKRLKAR